jgi:putative transferase (TIGR04331 family)
MKNTFLLLNGELPQSIRGARIFVLHSDRALRLSELAAEQDCEMHVLPVEASTREVFAKDVTFERFRYDKYIPILAERMRSIHKIKMSDLYWERVLGMTLLIHVSHCRRVFQAGQLTFNSKLNIIESEGFVRNLEYIPRNEVDHRQFFQYSDCGDEQLMGVYAENLHYRRSTNSNQMFQISKAKELPALPFFSYGRAISNHAVRLWRYRSLLLEELLLRLLKKFVHPKVVLIGVLWTHANRINAERRSRCKVQSRQVPIDLQKCYADIDWKMREVLSSTPEDADEFDRFFFSTLYRAAPLTWLETFSERRIAARSFLDMHPRLTHLVNETIDEDCLLVMAEAAARGVTNIYCEHNYLQHQYLGNMVWYTERKFDRYLSLGWKSFGSKKIFPTGSCFDWTKGERKRVPSISILYISDFGMVKSPVSSAGYGESGSPNVSRFIFQKRSFFASLSQSIRKKIYYRDYPKSRRTALRVHALDEEFCKQLIGQVSVFDTDGAISVTTLINCSRIVIVDYLSTPYLQCLRAGVPVIVLFNQESYYLTDEYSDFFDELITVGIFQTNPVTAGNFLTSIANDPDRWWNSAAVQLARSNFLNCNFGSSQKLIEEVVSFSEAKVDFDD